MNIAIAGAGVAGLTVAALLARAGRKVTVFDKLPKPSPVGSGLIVQPVGQAVLRAMGLIEAVEHRAAPLRKLNALNTAGRTVLDVRYDALGPEIYGFGIHRAALFDILFEAARESGAAFEPDREIADVETADSGLALKFIDSSLSSRFDLIIDALGVRSPLVDRKDAFLAFGALWTNIPMPDDPHFSPDEMTQRYKSADCSAGVMPIGEGRAALFWTLRQDAYAQWRCNGLEAWKGDMVRLWPEVRPCLDHLDDPDQLIFARYAHDTCPAPVEGRLVHIGDAWHAASPQLGQGANMALLDASALASALENEIDADKALARFLKTRAAHVRLFQAISWAFTPIYQSESKLLPALRDLLAGPVSVAPFMPKFLAAMVSGQLNLAPTIQP